MIIFRRFKGFFGIFAFIAAFAVVNFGQGRIEEIAAEVSSGSIEIKRSALLEIRNLKSEPAARAAIPALSDSDPRVRSSAAQAMKYLPASEAAALLRPLLADKDPFVRRETAYSLENGAASLLVPELTRMMFGDKAIEGRSAAAMALGGSGSPSAVTELVKVLSKKPDEDEEFLRRVAAHSIGRIAELIRGGHPTTTTPDNFLDEKYKTVDPGVLMTLPPEFNAATPLLLKILASQAEANDTRRESAFALGAIGDHSAVPALTAYSKDPDNYLAEICKEALFKLDKHR